MSAEFKRNVWLELTLASSYRGADLDWPGAFDDPPSL